MNYSLSPPRAPTDQLRLDSFRVLSRLRLITELRPWLGATGSAIHVLWHCLSFGAPLCALLNMLAPPYMDVDVDLEMPLDGRLALFTNFVERVKMLEMQGRMSYGEVLRVDDMFGGTATGFAKVLKTVQRVLAALQDCYPGLYVVPPRAGKQRAAFVQSLLDTEHLHVSSLGIVAESVLLMSAATGTVEPCLECLLINRSHLRTYHSQVLTELERVSSTPGLEDWVRIFGTNQATFLTRTVSSYRLICINYHHIHKYLVDQVSTLQSDLKTHAQTLLDIVVRIPSRISEYCTILAAILRVSSPSHRDDNGSYDSLCAALFQMQDASDNIDDTSREIRTMHAASILSSRALSWDMPSSDDVGSLLLDDVLQVDDETGLRYSVFLYDTVLLCCLEEVEADSEPRAARYPIHSWELGPALRGTSMLKLVYSISVRALRVVHASGSEGFTISWLEDDDLENVLDLTSSCAPQKEQWCSVFSALGVPIRYLRVDDQDSVSIISADSALNADGRRLSRPWSVRGHKASNSQSSSSSFIHFGAANTNEIMLSPGMLPALFGQSPPFTHASPSSKASSPYRAFGPPPTPPPEFVPVDDSVDRVLDLTGKVTREGRFSVAGGGFSDVWKGVWLDGDQQRPVAVKVLRSRFEDPETEGKMKQRLSRELAVWKKMHHPNILPLYGTVSDFGVYDSMVCPWLENGSVTKYLERCGDLLSMTDRLLLLVQVAEGLHYLHKSGVVHGDLTGSNILISDKGEAVLCDFGLSNVLAAFQNSSSSSSYTSSIIGGAIRWADASLYRFEDDFDGTSSTGFEPPFLTPPSDIYSFGSVTLEILSGRIPYHYVRSDAQVVIELHRGRKPRRPAQSFVTESQWSFIQTCWSDDGEHRPDAAEVLATVQSLYRASLDFRRHSAP